MVSGGVIKISEEEIEKKGAGRMLVITLTDNGSGISASIRGKSISAVF